MGDLLQFSRPRRERSADGARHVTGFALVLEARPGAVLMVADEIELGLTPEQARELGRELLELADDADEEPNA